MSIYHRLKCDINIKILETIKKIETLWNPGNFRLDTKITFFKRDIWDHIRILRFHFVKPHVKRMKRKAES